MQTLFIQQKEGVDANGKMVKREKKVYVLRAWTDASGSAIYLHADGTYGYKDGSPVKDGPQEFPKVMGNRNHFDVAMAWWERRGKKISKKFYEAKDEEERRVFEAASPTIEHVDALDMALYMRRPIKKLGSKAFSEALSWNEMGFKARPAWWGVVTMCQDKVYFYKMTNPEVFGLDQIAEPDQQQTTEEETQAAGNE